jgi:hypothetical protein
MAGYLDHYGEGYAKRHKRKKLIVAIVLVLVIGGGGLYLGLRNFRQKAKVTTFLELTRKKDYAAAYQLWGCTDAKPCPDYPFAKFMEDWGPKSRNAQFDSFRITKSRSCGSGVIVLVDLGQNREERFWVEGPAMTVGFSPWPACPSR